MRLRLLKRRLDEPNEVALRPSAGDGLDRLSALEDRQRWHRHNPVRASGLRVFVDVELDDADLVAHLHGDLFEKRLYLAAGRAPFGPKVDEHDMSDWSTSLTKLASVTALVVPTN